MKCYDPEAAGWLAGYKGQERKPPALYAEEWLVGYEDGWLDYEFKALIHCAELALAQDEKRRAS